MSAVQDYAAIYPHGVGRPGGVGGLRYALVLLVWLGLLAVRPRLALRIFRERRPDSPIPRLRRHG